MKKSLIALLMMVSFAMTFTGCKKDEEGDENNNVVLTNNSFAIDGVKINGNEDLGAIFAEKALVLTSQDAESTVTLLFGTKPTASGTYNFKGLLQIAELGEKDLILTVSHNSKNYNSTPALTEKVSVTITDGKATVTIPKITIKDADGASITFEAKLLEY